ncbi:MAG: STAS domain-containing protein [Burkholderiaceae bacterium]|nr:STAS domain-containing protein [Burkholderiaceae bacterium]
MTVKMTQRTTEPCHFTIEGEMTIYNSLELKDKLLAPLDQCAHMEIDLAGVSEIDSAGLQLLVMAKNEATARGKTLRISGHSPAVLEILDVCNLEGFFGDPVLIRSQESAHEF